MEDQNGIKQLDVDDRNETIESKKNTKLINQFNSFI